MILTLDITAAEEILLDSLIQKSWVRLRGSVVVNGEITLTFAGYSTKIKEGILFAKDGQAAGYRRAVEHLTDCIRFYEKYNTYGVDIEVYERFQAVCAKRGCSAANVLRDEVMRLVELDEKKRDIDISAMSLSKRIWRYCADTRNDRDGLCREIIEKIVKEA